MATRLHAELLLVEDDDFCRLLAVSMLRGLGYENVRTAANGEEAVQACRQSAFDLILMDCEMPVMNGWNATRAIRALGVRTPIVAYTASATAANISRCEESGMDDVLAKPARLGRLAQALGHWLARRDWKSGRNSSGGT